MIAVLLPIALQAAAAPIAGLPLAAIGRQALPARGCAAYLWTIGAEKKLVAMAVADPATIRLALDGGAPADFARAGENGTGGYGFAQRTEYQRGDATATLDMTAGASTAMAGGAVVREATLRIDRAGRDSIVVPVAGLIGCA